MSDPARPLPYGRQMVDEQDIAAVVDVLRSDWLTTGPVVGRFEQAFAEAVGARHAVAVANGTAALHCAYYALGLGPGDEVLVPALTFAATANAVAMRQATPVFTDVDPDRLLVDPASVEARLTPATRAIVAVDYAGQPCDYARLRDVATRAGVPLVADACHALGARYQGRPAGSLADVSIFSFHPVKHITTGEGGMVVTDDEALAARARLFRQHGISSDHRARDAAGTTGYEMIDLGFNYRLSDINCALGLSQLRRLDAFLTARRALAAEYDRRLAGRRGITPLAVAPDVDHAYHLYVVALDVPSAAARDQVASALRARGIRCAVHYPPVHLHPYYRRAFGGHEGLCPVAESQAARILSLPMFPGLEPADVARVVDALVEALPA
ncbi:MAG: UDP-4-amino-4,6-dideoxy-N-acetyl-beta-L-altrosamine transaminase [Vicinamibacterales bacterium]